MAFAESPKPVSIVGGAVTYYEEYTTTNTYVERVFGANISSITLSNDSATDSISASFNGAVLAADLKLGESLTLNVEDKTSVYIKGTTGGDNVRIWGW